jgi:stage II sporulation protein D
MLRSRRGNRRFKQISSVFLLFCCSFALLACGGKKRTPPVISRPADPSPAPPARAGIAKDVPRIRILVKEEFSSVRIAGSDLATVVVVRSDQQKIQLSDGSGRELGSASGFGLEARPGQLLELDGLNYRGILEIFINPLRIPVIVNELDLEDYLKGVVANELNPAAFPHVHAIKAQTVAARTFAFSNLGQYASRGFDLYSDWRSHAYRGKASEQSLSNRAVEETQGMVALYEKKAIVAFYSSTCGGLTASYQSVFQGAEIPYLRGGVKCPDQNSPYHTWKDHIFVTDLQENLDRVVGVGRLKKLVPLRKTQQGRMLEMQFVGSKGEKVLRGLKIRSALKLRSNWITDLDTRYDSSKYITEISAKGRGWGHGVGLCQMGTVELAQRGWSFERILKHYYPGVELDRRW